MLAGVVPYAELEEFFARLVATAQARGIPCGITSGMACVHLGIAATTKDCDVLCAVEKSDAFRELVATTPLHGLLPGYRGNISPPLDARWMRGGWTAHFVWKTPPDETCLDIFGVAPRGSSPWEAQLNGIHLRPNVVAEMKRTNRDKDWPFATALGGQMLNEGDPQGWLHLYDLEVLRSCAKHGSPPEALLTQRPVLGLAPFGDELRVKRLLLAERAFWSELDQLRVRIYQQHLRPYLSAVRRASTGMRNPPLAEAHEIRIACATDHLPFRPLAEFGLERMVTEAKRNVGVTIGEDVISWLPTAGGNFHGL